MLVCVVFCTVTTVGFVRRLWRARCQVTQMGKHWGEHLLRSPCRRPHFASCIRPHIRCGVSLARERFWVNVILANNGRMKDNKTGIICKGGIRKWAEVVPNETDLLTGRLNWLKWRLLYTYHNTFNNAGIYLCFTDTKIYMGRMNTIRRSQHGE